MRIEPVVTFSAFVAVACTACHNSPQKAPNVAGSSGCEVRATGSVVVRTASGQGVYVDGLRASARVSEIFIAGEPVVLRDSMGLGYRTGRIEGQVAVGALVRADGRATLVPAPAGDTAMYDPLLSYRGDGAWDVVWNRARLAYAASPKASEVIHAVFDGRTWSSVEQAARVDGADWTNRSTSPLVRTGWGLALAIPIPMPPRGDSGVALIFRRGDRWELRLVATGTGAGAGLVALHVAGDTVLIAYVTGDASPGGGANALYTRRSDDVGTTWRPPVRVVGSGVSSVELTDVGRGTVALLWTQKPASPDSVTEVRVARSLDAGATWDRLELVTGSRGVSYITSQVLSDRSALVSIQAGGPLRREQRLARVSEDRSVAVFTDSVDAARAPVLVNVGRDDFAMLWGRGDALPNGGGVLPQLVLQRLTVSCPSSPS